MTRKPKLHNREKTIEEIHRDNEDRHEEFREQIGEAKKQDDRDADPAPPAEGTP